MSPKRSRENGDSDLEDDEQSDEEEGIRIDDEIYIPPPPRRMSQIRKNGARLIISKIRITNFKSYAGKVELGPFDKHFSAIVGPNGSGKSNVIDAMLFVFGFRASKIRSTSVGVLIHNSAEHPKITSCKVSIYFEKVIEEPEGYRTIPNTQLKISRRGYKNNSSRYEMNDKEVPFKAIERQLKSEGIDLDLSRFLILQGEVEQIALMKPKAANENDTGMLEFLDTIIGTNRIKEPLVKISEKLEDLTEKFKDDERRLRVVEEQRDELRELMKEAVQYLKRENVITELRNTYFQVKKYDTLQEVKDKENANREFEEQHANLMEEIKNVKKNFAEKTGEYDEKNKKWSDVQRRKDRIDQRYQELSTHDENLHSQLVEANKRRKENKVKIEKELENLEELQRAPEKNAKDIEECENFIEKQEVIYDREKRELEEITQAIQQKTEPLTKEREVFERQRMKFTEELNQARAALNLAETELNVYLSMEETEREALEKVTDELQTATQKIQEYDRELKSLEKKLPKTEETFEKAKDRLKVVKAREAELSDKLTKLRATYNEQSHAMNSNKSRNKILVALMEEKNSKRIPGILGRLGDLGGIDAKYDIAVSTACGPLDNIVVDTVETAEACINFLKEKNIGRMTFIALEKQQHLVEQMNKAIKTPENVPRLFDLIQVKDQRVKPAFYFALRNTLVAQDLEQATRIAYGERRYRVVTLKGELIETSGTMSGGGIRAISGRMGQSVRTAEVSPEDLERLRKKLDDVFNECNTLRAQQPALEEQIRTLSTELQEMQRNKVQFSSQFEKFKALELELKKKLKLQENKVKKAVIDPKKVEQLTKAKDEMQENFEIVNSKFQKIQDKIDKINSKINEIAGTRINEKRKLIDNLKEGIEKAKKEITRLKVASNAAKKNVAKIKLKIEDLENSIEQCVKIITDGQKEKAELEEEAKELKQKQTEYLEALRERDQVLEGLTQEIKELKSQADALKLSKIDLDSRVDASRKEIAEYQKKVKDYDAKLAALKLNKIPEHAEEALKEFTDDELANLDAKTVGANLAAAKERLPKEMPDLKNIEEFERVNQRYLKRANEFEELSTAKNVMRDHYNSITKMRRDEFKVGFDKICQSLKELYQMISHGGAADLEYADSLDPYADGIVLSIRPPKKSWKNIRNLSGGEKTLSSLALIFALHNYKPTPLYFMDEIDAALDFKNVSIIANYIQDSAENVQFTVVSLRSEMFELAGTLVGIYKTKNSSKSVTVDMVEFYKLHPEFKKKDRHDNPPRKHENGFHNENMPLTSKNA
ncbi:GSCOCG00001375001-RA-CDS [Cotesia congregata]|nr:GSCOCG00001375001-RA-CDS [Cotesia congregata]